MEEQKAVEVRRPMMWRSRPRPWPARGTEERREEVHDWTRGSGALGLAPATMRAWRHKGVGPPYQQLAGKGTQAIYDPDVVDWFVKNVWPANEA